MFSCSLDSDLYKQSSDVSYQNMYNLAKKHQDQNNLQFQTLFNETLCNQYNSTMDGSYIPSQWINNKHCDFIRDKYNMSFWDEQHSTSLLNNCIPEKHIQNTKNKTSLYPTKPVFNCIPDSIESNGRYASVPQNCNVNNGLKTRYNNHTHFT